MWEYSYAYSDHLEHHGILGQKWGVRRFQNSDGSLTPEGRLRYQHIAEKSEKTANTAKKVLGESAKIGGLGLGIGSGVAGAALGGYVTDTALSVPMLLGALGVSAGLTAPATVAAIAAGTAYVTSKIKQNNAEKKLIKDKSKNTSMDKESRINRAKNEDRWDLGFLEAIQNKKISINKNKSAMLKEYEKYLDDPNDYWKNGVNKLEDYK